MSDPLAKYTFLPWMRQGLASQLKVVDHLGDVEGYTTISDASTIDLELVVQGEKEVNQTKSDSKTVNLAKQVKLYHAGDITGIEKRAIIKTEPRNGVREFEANFLPYIDFYEEDFPWRYTPLQANKHRLRPWLALVVLKQEEFVREKIDPRLPLPSIKMTEDLDKIPFPPAYQLWAWAHVHANKEIDTKADLKDTLNHSPNAACSRLICPRKLEPETQYVAFLIPSFEKGRLAGLGVSANLIDATDIQLPAWGHEQNQHGGDSALYQKRFPFYYEWTFTTAEEGADFETLAKKIVPSVLHPNVGKRSVDIQSPGYNIFYEGGEFPNPGTVLMEGALRHPDSNVPDLLDVAKDTELPNHQEAKTFINKLADLINLEEDLKADTLSNDQSFATNPYFEEEGESVYDDPIITPPLYGRWHANQSRVSPDNNNQWVDELNLDPRYRIAAGLGAEVIRRNQEDYMNRAWKQFGELFEVNDFFKKSQLTVEVNKSVFKKHLEPLHPAKFISVTSNMHRTIRTDSRKSVKRALHHAPSPDGVFSSGFEKITRRGGRLIKRTQHFTPVPNKPTAKISTLKMSDYSSMINQGEAVFTQSIQLRFLLHDAFTNLNNIEDWKKTALADRGLVAGLYHSLDENYSNDDYKIFQEALGKIVKNFSEKKANYFQDKHWKLKASALPSVLDQIKDKVAKKLRPSFAFPKKIKSQVKHYNASLNPILKEEDIKPILNAPIFKDATYEEIIKISIDEFVPNLDLVLPNTSGLLEINRKFIEAFMVGLNYEMARELLWREFPTDQRGTYFKMFWDSIDYNARQVEQRKDIEDIHTWKTGTALGTHQQIGSETEQLVLVIKADLLNRYPNTIIYLEKAKIINGERRLSGVKEDRKFPLFEAQVAPDVFFLGFDISKEAVLEGETGYFFVIQERPGEVHFGLDSELQAKDDFTSWNDFNWKHLPPAKQHHINIEDELLEVPMEHQSLNWGRGAIESETKPHQGNGSSADMACILYQNPVKIAVHASAMLKE